MRPVVQLVWYGHLRSMSVGQNSLKFIHKNSNVLFTITQTYVRMYVPVKCDNLEIKPSLPMAIEFVHQSKQVSYVNATVEEVA